MKNFKKTQNGFTLIEMLIGLVIIVTLTISAMTFFNRHSEAQRSSEDAEQSFEAMLLPLRTLKRDIEYSSNIVDNSPPIPSDVKSVQLTGQKVLPDNTVVPIITTYTLVTSLCSERSLSNSCKILSRSVSVGGAAADAVHFPDLEDVEWCVQGEAPPLGLCSTELMSLVPPDAVASNKRFLLRLSRSSGLKTQITVPLVIDLENAGYPIPGAAHTRPQMLRSQ